MSSPNLKVFISSTFQDLQAYRDAAFKAIQTLGAQGDNMIFWTADERSGTVQSVERVRQCDLLILILAHRYGYIQDGDVRSVVEQEYDAARNAQIPILAFFIEENIPWPPDQVEWEKKEQLRLFKHRIESEVTRMLFRSPEELALQVTQSLALFMERHRDTLKKQRRFSGYTVQVHSNISLKHQPNTVLHIGEAEDGLPLLLSVERAHDLNKHLEALAKEINTAKSQAPDALLSQFKQTLEQFASKAWIDESLSQVTMLDGTTRQLYVSSSNLTDLFQSSLSAIFIAGRQERLTWAKEKNKDYNTQATVIGAANASAGPALQSEGGKNRFLGIDPETGSLSSVGWSNSRCVQWRHFKLESLQPNFPGINFEIGKNRLKPQRGAYLAKALFDFALEHATIDRHHNYCIAAYIPRQEIGLLLAKIAAHVASVHDRGLVHGDLKPSNILLCAEGPVLIDAFEIPVGKKSPGWTPDWSAPEQILGQEVCCASDVFPLGRMVADLLGGCLVGEVRKFKTRPIANGDDEFNIFYNPLVHLESNEIVSSKGLLEWQSFVRDCLRFETRYRQSSAAVFQTRLLELLSDFPLSGEIQLSFPGELYVAELPDGSQAMTRIIRDNSSRNITGFSNIPSEHDTTPPPEPSKPLFQQDKRCPSGRHIMDPGWDICPYCVAESRSADKTNFH